MDEISEEKIKKVIKIQALVRGFLCRKNNNTFINNTYRRGFGRGFPGRVPPGRGFPGRGPPGRGPGRGFPGRGPPGMSNYYTQSDNNVDEEKKTDEEADEEKSSDRDKHTKKKSISMNNIISLAKLVQKEVVNEDEFRDIVKRIRKRNEEVEWSLKQELILKSIGEKSCCYFLLHRDISENYRKMYQKSMMWIFTQTMFSSVIMFIASGIHNSCEQDALLIIPLIAGALNLLIAFQQKILEFKQPERYMLEHATTSKSFREIYDDINIQLGLARKERNPMPLYLSTIRDKYIMCKKIAPYVSKTNYRDFEDMYLNRNDPSSIDGTNRGNFINAYQTRDIVIDVDSLEILSRKKQNGIPEDILGLTPIDISRRDILLSDMKRELDNDEEKLDYELRSKHKKKLLRKKYEQDEEYGIDINFNSESDSSDNEIDDKKTLFLKGPIDTDTTDEKKHYQIV